MTNETEQLILTHLIELKQDVGKIDGKLDATIDAHSKRLDDLENDSKWQWRVNLATLPIIAALHEIAGRLGWTKH